MLYSLTRWFGSRLPLVLVLGLTAGALAQTNGPYSLENNEVPTFLVVQGFFQQTVWRDTAHRRPSLEEELGVSADSEAFRIVAEAAHLAGRIQIEPPPPELLVESPEAWSEAQDRNLEEYVVRLAVHFGELLTDLDSADVAPNLNGILLEVRATTGAGSSGPDGLEDLKRLDELFLETVRKEFSGTIPEGRK